MGSSDPISISGGDDIDVYERDYEVTTERKAIKVLDRLADEFGRELIESEHELAWQADVDVAVRLGAWINSDWELIEYGLENIDEIHFGRDTPYGYEEKVEEAYRMMKPEYEETDNGLLCPDAETPADVTAYANYFDFIGDGIETEKRVRREVLHRYRPEWYGLDSDEYDIDEIGKEEAVGETARIFDDEWHFLMPDKTVDDWPNVLHRYDPDKGIYRWDGEDFVEAKAEFLLGDAATNNFVNELVSKIKRRNIAGRGEIQAREPDHNELVVGNGILDLYSGDLRAYTAEEYHRTRIDVDYDPSATCEEIDEFFHEVVSDDDVDTLYRLAGHMLLKKYVSEKAALFVGEGANGKSTVEELYRRFLGNENVSSRGLQRLVNYKFAAKSLYGRLANLEGDLSPNELEDSRMFKKLTGGDEITGDVKNSEEIEFENYASLVFAVNQVPESPEDSEGWWRRWMYLQFPHQFKGEDAEPEEQILGRIASEDQLEGLLARAVEETKRYHETGVFFPDSASVDETREQMKNAANPVRDFATTVFLEVDNPDGDYGKVLKSRVVEAYDAYAAENNLPGMNSNKVKEELQQLADIDIDSGQSRALTDGDRRDQVFTGVEWTPRGRQLSGLDEPDDGQQDLEGSNEIAPEVSVEDVLDYAEDHPDADVYGVMRAFELRTDCFDEVEQLLSRSQSPNGDELDGTSTDSVDKGSDCIGVELARPTQDDD